VALRNTIQCEETTEKHTERERESSTGHPRRGQVDPCLVASRGDFNETIATHGGPLGAEVRLLRVVVAAVGGDGTWLAGVVANMWTVLACRGQACTQFVSSSDNYAIMLAFLPSHLVASLARL